MFYRFQIMFYRFGHMPSVDTLRVTSQKNSNVCLKYNAFFSFRGWQPATSQFSIQNELYSDFQLAGSRTLF